jgi:hypothetical protein
MYQRINKIAIHTGRAARNWLAARLRECITCRECSKPVRPWDDCCAHCGFAHPARVSQSVMIVVGVGCLLMLMLVIVF